jgi:hypothetical protein
MTVISRPGGGRYCNSDAELRDQTSAETTQQLVASLMTLQAVADKFGVLP